MSLFQLSPLLRLQMSATLSRTGHRRVCTDTQVAPVKGSCESQPPHSPSRDHFMGNVDGRGGKDDTPSHSAHFLPPNCSVCVLASASCASKRWMRWASCSLSSTHLWWRLRNTHISFLRVSHSEQKTSVKRRLCVCVCLCETICAQADS